MLRKISSRLMYHSGVVAAWLRRPGVRARVGILTLHSVLDLDRPPEWLPIRSYHAKADLDRGLSLLSKHHTFVTLDQAAAILRGEVDPVPNPLVLTFDDGYLNNFEVALPVLEQHDAPATFFVVGDAVLRQEPFWFDRLDYALQMNARAGEEVSFLGESFRVVSMQRIPLRRTLLDVCRLALATKHDDRSLSKLLDEDLQRLERAQGHSLLEKIDRASPCALASESDIRRAAAHPLVEIGSHTMTHARLPGMSEAEQRCQLEESKRVIESVTDTECRYFCYPNGRYDAASAGRVQDAGYAGGVTCDEGFNNAGCNPFTLNRVNWSPTATPEEILIMSAGMYPS